MISTIKMFIQLVENSMVSTVNRLMTSFRDRNTHLPQTIVIKYHTLS